MPKIQLLNETQVQHFVDLLLPELTLSFNEYLEKLKGKVIEIKDNFDTHAEVIKIQESHDTLLKESLTLVELYRQVKTLDPNVNISSSYHDSKVVALAKAIARDRNALTAQEMKKDQEVNELKTRLIEESLFIDKIAHRAQTLKYELTAKLSVFPVKDFAEVKKQIVNSIDIKSFFTNKISK
jgi:hypothetical protein